MENTNTTDNDSQSPRESEYHDERNRFKKGNQAGRLGKGIPKGERRRERAAAARAAEEIRQEALARSKKLISSAIPDLVQHLRDKALNEDDIAAAQTLLRHGLPLGTAETSVVGGDGLDEMPPEARIIEINKRLSRAEMPLEHGRALADLARQEIEASVIVPIKMIMGDLKRGIPPTEAIARLIHLADQLDAIDAIDAEVVEPEPETPKEPEIPAFLQAPGETSEG